MIKRIFILLLLAPLLLPVTGCSTFDSVEVENSYPIDPDDARRLNRGKLGGEGGLKLFGGDDEDSGGNATLGVNSFLWRATLDTLSFVPLSSVDPRGGVIISDWYEAEESEGERFKINVVLLGTKLRSDAVRVSVFKQNYTGSRWKDAKVPEKVANELEEKILTRARELRIAASR